MTMAKQTINNPIKERKSLSKKLTAEIMNLCEFHMPTSGGGTRDEPLRTSASEGRRHRTGIIDNFAVNDRSTFTVV